MSTTEAQVQTEAPAETKKASTKVEKTGSVIIDVAHELENMTKVKAINLATQLVEEQGSNDFKLGGLFLKIQENSWYDGHDSFDAFVTTKFGFAPRKAYYLIDIYRHLTTKNIPWEKVSAIGWTKLRDLAPILTLENLDSWVEKAKAMSAVELRAVLSAGVPTAEENAPVTGTSDVTTFKLKAKKDQVDTYVNAIAKAKAETGTTFDAVGLETICVGYLAGTVAAAPVSKPMTLKDLILSAGWQDALIQFSEVFPGVNIAVTSVNEAGPTVAFPAAESAPATDAAPATT